jgi:hypothetical protein
LDTPRCDSRNFQQRSDRDWIKMKTNLKIQKTYFMSSFTLNTLCFSLPFFSSLSLSRLSTILSLSDVVYTLARSSQWAEFYRYAKNEWKRPQGGKINCTEFVSNKLSSDVKGNRILIAWLTFAWNEKIIFMSIPSHVASSITVKERL